MEATEQRENYRPPRETNGDTGVHYMEQHGEDGDDGPYGYVYVGDTRVGFDQAKGVWEAHGWPSTLNQRLSAYRFLRALDVVREGIVS